MSDPRKEDPFAGRDAEFGDEAARALAGGPGAPLKQRHPSGLWVLFITEMWERFSYYGMRALFVLYLVATTSKVLENGEDNANPGFGWSEADAYTLYGVYTFMVYITSIFGGIAADRLLGTHRSMLVGGWIIAAGHITLAMTELFEIEAGLPVTLETSPGSLMAFLIGCSLIIIGTGFFKPCVSVMVGQLYRANDPRRDSGFTIFYMGINLGALLSPLVAGYLGEKVGWHWGFGSAAVGMIVGLIFYQLYRGRYLEGVGMPPAEPMDGKTKALVLAAVAALIGTPAVPLALYASGGLGLVTAAWDAAFRALGLYGMAGLLAGVVIAAIGVFLAMQPRGERAPLGVVFVLAFFGNIFFWTAFEQAGSSLNIFAAQNTDRGVPIPAWFLRLAAQPAYGYAWLLIGAAGLGLCVPLWRRVIAAPRRNTGEPTPPRSIGSWIAVLGAKLAGLALIGALVMKAAGTFDDLGPKAQFPASWYQSANPLAILLFAPVFSWLWVWLERRRANPSTPMKFAVGLWLLGLAFLAMVAASLKSEDGGLAGPHWLLITYVVVTWGELCLSPVGLSVVTKLSPRRLQSLMMGLWFFSLGLANLTAGLVARFSTKFIEQEDGTPATLDFVMEGLPGFFLMLVVFPVGAGLVVALISPVLRRMMGDVK